MSFSRPNDGEQLRAALAKCRGGEHIQCGDTIVDGWIAGVRFDRPVSISGRFRSSLARGKLGTALNLRDVSGVTLVDCDIEGHVRSRFDRLGRVLEVSDSRNVRVERSRLHGCWQGAWIYRSQQIAVSGCDFEDLGPFGIQLAGVEDAAIEDNAFRAFNVYLDPTLDPSISEHADAIMLFTAPGWGAGSEWAERGSKRVSIRRNFVLGDPDNRPQGIFVRDAGGGGRQGYPFEDVAIEDNQVWGGMWGGIATESCVRLQIVGNVVRHIDGGRPAPGGAQSKSWIIADRVPEGLARNVASLFIAGDKWLDHAGVNKVGPATMAEAEAAYQAWRQRRAPAPPVDPRAAEIERLTAERGQLDAQRAQITRRIRQIDSRLRTLRRV
jgi:hypothetical protein